MKNLIKNKYRYFIMGIFIFSFFCFNNVKAETTLTNDLKGYWKLDESSGSTITDSVGSANGTINGATYTSSGKINGAYSFDGNNDYIYIENNSSLEFGNGNFTISAFFKSSSGEITIWDSGAGGAGFAYIWCYFVDNGKTIFRIDDGTNSVDITDDLSNYFDEKFHHIVFMRNGNTIYLYINNELINSANASNVGSVSNSYKNYIGMYDWGRYNEDKHFSNGIIDEIGIWSRALTTNEITELYNSGAGLQYPFEEEEEPEDPDPEPQDPSNLGNGYIEFTGVILLLGIVIWSINQLNKIFYG